MVNPMENKNQVLVELQDQKKTHLDLGLLENAIKVIRSNPPIGKLLLANLGIYPETLWSFLRVQRYLSRAFWLCAEILVMLGHQNAKTLLEEKLNDTDVMIKWSAAIVLARTGDSKWVKHLQGIMSKMDLRLFGVAAETLYFVSKNRTEMSAYNRCA